MDIEGREYPARIARRTSGASSRKRIRPEGEELSTRRKCPSPVRPTTDAIVLTVRVHQAMSSSNWGTRPPASGATLGAAGRRILRNHLRRAIGQRGRDGAAGQPVGQRNESE